MGIAFGAGVAFASTVVIGRGAGAVAVGQFFQFVAVFSVASTVVTFGSDTGLVRFLAADRATARFGRIRSTVRIAVIPVAVTGCVAALAALGLSLLPATAPLVAHIPQEGLALGAPFLVIAGLLAVVLGALRGLGRIMEFTALQNVLLPLLRLAGIAAVISVGFTVDALLLVWLLPLALVATVALVLLLRHLPKRDAGTGTAAAATVPAGDVVTVSGRRTEFWHFATARGLSAILEMILEWIDVLAVAVFLGPRSAGVYAVVTRCVRVGQMVDHAVRTVSSPLISGSLALDDHAGTRRIFTVSGRCLVLLAWPFYLLLIIHAPSILGLFGAEFAAGAGALRVISAAMLVTATAGGVQSMLLMGGRSQWQVANKVVALAVALVLNLTLVPLLGIMGAAIAWAAAILVDCALATWQVATRMGVRLPLAQLRLPILLVTACFGLPLLVLALVLPPTTGSLVIGMLVAATSLVIAVLLARHRLGLPLGRRTVVSRAPAPAAG